MTEIPDIVDRCLAASADDRLSSGQLYREAAEEIKLLRLAIARIAEQDATLSVCNGNVFVEMDVVLTDAEREAVQFGIAAVSKDEHAAAMMGLLKRHRATSTRERGE